MLMNALQESTHVMLMLTVSIRLAHTTVPVNWDTLEMDSTVQVAALHCSLVYPFQISPFHDFLS